MTPNIEVVHDWIVENYPGYTHIGITNCRRIADSQTYSQHSWSNALDVHCSKAYGDILVVALVEQFGDDIYELIWQAPGHFDHIHVSTWPKGWLTPPCAGGTQRIKYENGTVQTAPFPLTIQEEDMPLTDADVEKIVAAVVPKVVDGVWFRLIPHAVEGVPRGAQKLLADILSYAYSGATRTVPVIVDVDEEAIAEAVADEFNERLDS